MIDHFTMIDEDTDEKVGCSSVLFKQEIQDKLGIYMIESDKTLCEECQEDNE